VRQRREQNKIRAMEAVVFIGIQGSGKSSFYKERFFNSHVRINLDMLKTKYRQQLLIDACIAGKQPFVVDNTNVTAQGRAKFIVPAKAAGFRVVGYYFRSDVKAALLRNSLREGVARVPDKGLLGTYKRLQLPRQEEGFDALYYVRVNEAGEFVVEEWVDEV
jgi:predicted kinase